MGKRTYESDIIAMSLLYRKEYVGTDMILYEKAINYDRVINSNLEEMNSSCGILIRNEEESLLYFLVQGEDKKLYAVIRPDADLKKAWSCHVGCLPTDVIVAAQMDNALSERGLIMVDGKFRDRNLYYDELLEYREERLIGPVLRKRKK